MTDKGDLFMASIQGDQLAIPAVVMRGGTSRGLFFLGRDLPQEADLRNRIILVAFGSPDPRQIDGLGGGDPLTSKVIIVDPPSRPDADVDYTFGQVRVVEPVIDYSGNCGNLSAAVAPFAIDEGLVQAYDSLAEVRIHNTNTDKVIVAEVPVRKGQAVYDGDCAIGGVPGKGAQILLNFRDCQGSVTGHLLPSGSPRDTLATAAGEFEVSFVDAANPCVFVRASALGLTGTELPSQLVASLDVMTTLECIRAAAAEHLGLVTDRREATAQSPALPKIAMVAPPQTYYDSNGASVGVEDITLVARMMTMQQPHKAYAVTGAICTAVAAVIKGTLVNEVSQIRGETVQVRIGHPAGVITVEVRLEEAADGLRVARAALERTARRLMCGTVFVPLSRLQR